MASKLSGSERRLPESSIRWPLTRRLAHSTSHPRCTGAYVLSGSFGRLITRQVPRIVQEISRVLAVRGRFVDVSRSDPTIRLRQWLGHMGFATDELNELVSMSRLYPGRERVAGIAEQYGLKLAGLDEVSCGSSHNRTVSVFVKEQDSRSWYCQLPGIERNAEAE